MLRIGGDAKHMHEWSSLSQFGRVLVTEVHLSECSVSTQAQVHVHGCAACWQGLQATALLNCLSGTVDKAVSHPYCFAI